VKPLTQSIKNKSSPIDRTVFIARRSTRVDMFSGDDSSITLLGRSADRLRCVAPV